jgi:hypothetical protein
MDWQNLTVGDAARLAIAKFRKGRRALRRYSPIKVDLSAAKNLFQAISPLVIAPILYILQGFEKTNLLPEAQVLPPPERHKPWYRRTAQVEQTLEIAWFKGVRKYDELMQFVREWTGTGCSRRAIAKFVKAQRLYGSH